MARESTTSTGLEIRPIQFAYAIQYALAYRSRGDGMSTYEACSHALREAMGFKPGQDVWIAPLCAFLNDSPSAAEAWAQRRVDETLARAFGSEVES